VYVLFNLALASAVKSTLTLDPFAVVLMYWFAPLAPEPSPLMLNLIPPVLSRANLVVSVLPSAPKLILLYKIIAKILDYNSLYSIIPQNT